MDAKLLLRERHILSENSFVEIVVWRLPASHPDNHHGFKYRLALVVDCECVLRFDNESGKGDHKHIGKDETPYVFTTPEALLEDFWHDIYKWRS